MGSLNFGKDTAEDKYASFLSEYKEYMDDDLSIPKAQRVATSAWHLIDWAFENDKCKHNFTDLSNFREALYPRCASLKIMHDLATATKHLTVSKPKADIRDTRKHAGTFSAADFSDDFDIPRLEIEKSDGKRLSFRREMETVLNFWKSYFNY
ncbi:MAG TPA: hypothetical protein PL009_09310 [Flavipsychrobacter sp.]|nr:hypothetical protein [Flavipsychrobacter sp.]